MKRHPMFLLSNKLNLSMEQSLLLLLTLIALMVSASILWISWIRIDSHEQRSQADSALRDHADTVFNINLELQLLTHQAEHLLPANEIKSSINKEEFVKELRDIYFYLNEVLNSESTHSRESLEPRAHTLLIRNLESGSQQFSTSMEELALGAGNLPQLLQDIEQLKIVLSQIERLDSRDYNIKLKGINKIESDRYQYFFVSIFIFVLIGSYLSFSLYLSIRRMMRGNIQSENQIRSMMNSTAQAIYSIDLRGICTFCNNTCVQLLGYESQADLIGHNMHSLIHHTRANGDHYPEDESLILQMVTSQNKVYESTEVFWKQDKTPFNVEYWAYPIANKKGDMIGRVIAFFDITERLKTEEQLNKYQTSLENMVRERTQKLNQTHAELVRVSHKAGMSEVAGGVLHNVGNVLNSLNIGTDTAIKLTDKLSFKKLDNLAGLLASHISSPSNNPLDADVPKYVKLLGLEMEENREKLVDEMISLSNHSNRIKNIIATQQKYAATSGKGEFVDVRLIIEDSLSINADLIEQEHIKVYKDYSGDTNFQTQQHKLLQILINLISNAAKVFTEAEPANKTPEIHIVTECSPTGLKIKVRDNGSGIEKADLKRIFGLGVTTRKSGHGLGLHIAATMAQEIGGKLSAENNQSGPGATFILSLA